MLSQISTVTQPLGGISVTLRPVGFDSRPVCPSIGPVGPTSRTLSEWPDRSARPVGFPPALANFRLILVSPPLYFADRSDRPVGYFSCCCLTSVYLFQVLRGPVEPTGPCAFK